MAAKRQATPKPLFRYYGGKRRLAPRIVDLMPTHLGYVEPFCGSAAVLFAKPRSRWETINDLNSVVVRTFRAVRERQDELSRMLYLTPYSREEYQRACDIARSGWEGDDLTVAWAMLVLIWQGLSRGRPKANTWCTQRARDHYGAIAESWARMPGRIAGVVERLRAVSIENRPALDVIRTTDSERTVIYCDPPYHPSTIRSPDYKVTMTADDHEELLAALRGARGMVMLSGYRCALYDGELTDWHRVDLAHSCMASAPMPGADIRRVESLWLNAACMAALEAEGRAPAPPA